MKEQPTLDLPAIEARANAATPGPWGYVYNGSGDWSVGHESDPRNAPVATVHGCSCQDDQPDVAFVAAARTDVPALAEALREAVEVLRNVEWAIDDGEDVCPSCQTIRYKPFTDEEEGHDPGCRIAALLGRVKT